MSDVDRESWVRQTGENSARLAFAWGQTTSKGSGHIPYDESIDFGLTYLEKPRHAYGFEVTNYDPDANYDPDTGDTIPPASSGFVYMWITNARGFYTGAHVAVTVTASDDTELIHTFTFAGIAMKDVTATRETLSYSS